MGVTKTDIKSKYRKYYLSSINRAIDYIEQNIDKPLDLLQVAEVANFSPFHFHRIFAAIKAETLNNFIKRKRLEKAASMLINSAHSITEIAINCGFSSNAVFARSFKNHFNMSASKFRENGFLSYFEKMGERNANSKQYFERLETVTEEILLTGKRIYKEVQVKELPKHCVAYSRHYGRFEDIGTVYERLFRWAGPRGLLQWPEMKAITLYHDDPKITDIDKLQQSACITIDPSVKVEGDIGKLFIEGGKYACAKFEITELDFTAAWTSLCAGWLPESGYEGDNRFPYELYHNDHTQHPEKKFIVDICIPVKPITNF